MFQTAETIKSSLLSFSSHITLKGYNLRQNWSISSLWAGDTLFSPLIGPFCWIKPSHTTEYILCYCNYRSLYQFHTHAVCTIRSAVCEEWVYVEAAIAVSVSQRDQKCGLQLSFQMSSTDIMASLIQAN